MIKGLKWLPHFTISQQKVLFLENINTNITVSKQLEEMLRETADFTFEQLEITESRVGLQKLLDDGIVVPYESSISNANAKENIALFIQPHSDDIALSCSGTAFKLYRENSHNIKLVTVFSEYSSDSFPWKEKIQIDDFAYTRLRQKEDECAAGYLYGSCEFLGYRDAVARGTNLGVISRHGIIRKDIGLISRIADSLWQIVQKHKPRKIFLPAAIGWHYDHIITMKAAMSILKGIGHATGVYLYEDYPYCDQSRYNYWARLKELKDEMGLAPVYVGIESYLNLKVVLINFYRSQFTNWSIKEIGKLMRELAISTVNEAQLQNHPIEESMKFAERVWKIAFKGGKLEGKCCDSDI